jgi:hypothetical protein
MVGDVFLWILSEFVSHGGNGSGHHTIRDAHTIGGCYKETNTRLPLASLCLPGSTAIFNTPRPILILIFHSCTEIPATIHINNHKEKGLMDGWWGHSGGISWENDCGGRGDSERSVPSTFSEAGQCDVIVITAGAKQHEGGSCLDLVGPTRSELQDLGEHDCPDEAHRK